jgi:hypothetical protein
MLVSVLRPNPVLSTVALGQLLLLLRMRTGSSLPSRLVVAVLRTLVLLL